MKKNKLELNKFKILRLTNPYNFKGGTGESDTNLTTNTDSEDTTYTTDPNEPCPNPDPDPTHTTNPTNGNVTIPTLYPPTANPGVAGC
jgi:hypothetical protein